MLLAPGEWWLRIRICPDSPRQEDIAKWGSGIGLRIGEIGYARESDGEGQFPAERGSLPAGEPIIGEEAADLDLLGIMREGGRRPPPRDGEGLGELDDTIID